jgi:hypothetical protein
LETGFRWEAPLGEMENKKKQRVERFEIVRENMMRSCIQSSLEAEHHLRTTVTDEKMPLSKIITAHPISIYS